DENHKPVAGASVLFLLPRSGASGTFANGATSLRVTTDQQGRAVARGLRPNTRAGRFEIAVTASLGALTARLVIHQSNAVNPPASPASSNQTTAGTGRGGGNAGRGGAEGAGAAT